MRRRRKAGAQLAPMASVDLCAGASQGTRMRKRSKAIRQRTMAAAQHGRRAHARQSLPREPEDQEITSGDRMALRRLRHVSADRQSFSPEPSFVDTARDNLHYLLGRNTFSLSWVTQVGENPFQHPHHRPSGDGSTAAMAGTALRRAQRADVQDARCSASCPRICRRRRSMPIRRPRMPATKSQSTGRLRWCFCWPASCDRSRGTLGLNAALL